MNKTGANMGFGNRLADGITISCQFFISNSSSRRTKISFFYLPSALVLYRAEVLSRRNIEDQPIAKPWTLAPITNEYTK